MTSGKGPLVLDERAVADGSGRRRNVGEAARRIAVHQNAQVPAAACA
ncbi:hypothetical protein [Streptomyces sp. NPDC059874]